MPVNPSQQEAITFGEGPALVLAGPGSGKTLTITRRVDELIRGRGADPRQILVITFTRAAALEMRERYFALAKERLPVAFGTFHSVFLKILRTSGACRTEDIITEDKKLHLVIQILRELNVSGEDEKDLALEAAAQISLVKNEQIPLEHYYSPVLPDEAFRTLCRRYDRMLRDAGLLDFDDILVRCRELLLARPDILKGWQERFAWVLVDEFQDINALQYEILCLLAAPQNNIFAVGDDDQSIYRFRGAKPEIMQRFKKDHPEAAVIELEENYRSAPQIVDAARRVIGCNENRFEKKTVCAGPSSGEVTLTEFPDPDREYDWICGRIKDALGEGRSADEIAVLFRTNAGGRAALRHLDRMNIPYRIGDEIPDLFDHWIAQDLLSYLRLAAADRRALPRRDLLRVMNKPLRYIGRNALPGETVDAAELEKFYEDSPWMAERVRALTADLDRIAKMRPYAAVNYVYLGIGYDRYLAEYARAHGMQLQELTDVVLEVQEEAKSQPDLETWELQIADRRARAKEEAKRRSATGAEREKTPSPAVVLSTLHGSKGLEFEEVFLPDLNEGTIPHRKSQLAADIEEERRLLYVGMTRAKRSLHLCWAAERYGRKCAPSRFLSVLRDEEQNT